MSTRRFNWIVLLVGGLIGFSIAAGRVAMGDPSGAVGWLAFGSTLVAGSFVLRRMRLP